jgi:hypothetical protein
MTTLYIYMHRCAHLYTLILSIILETVAIYWNINYDIMGNHGQTLRYVLLPSLTTLYFCIVLLFCSEKLGSQYVSICLNNFDVLCILNTFEQFRYVINCYYMCIQLSSLFNLFYTILHQDVLDVFCMGRFGIERQCMTMFDIRPVLLFLIVEFE